MAFVAKSALATGGASVTPVYTTATAGNVLVALVSANSSKAGTCVLSGSTTGWTKRASAIANPGAAGEIAEIWDKIAVGSDVMPTWTPPATATLSACIVAEFSSTTVFDQGGTQIGTVTPLTATATAIDGGTGRLIVALVAERNTAATTTFTDNVNSLGVGTGINILGDNGATSQANHHHSIYVTTATTGTVADKEVATWSVVSTRAAVAIASYKVSGGTTFPQTLTVVTTTVPAITKRIGKSLAVVTTTAPTITKQIGKLVSVVTVTAPSLFKRISKTLSVVTTTAPTLLTSKFKLVLLSVVTTTVPAITKQIGKGLSVVTTTAPTITKRISKTLSVVTTTAPTLLTSKFKLVLLSVVTTTVPAITKQIGKLVSVATVTQPTVTKRISKTLAVSTTTVPTITKQIGKGLSAVTAPVVTVLTSFIQAIQAAIGRGFTSNYYSQVILSDGAIAYWRLNDTGSMAVDATGNGHDGVITGGVTVGVPGAISDGDAAMRFDGTSGKIDVPYSPALNPLMWSVEGRYFAAAQAANNPILDCRPASSGALAAGFDLFINAGTGIGISVCSTNVAQTILAASVPNHSVWHHAIATYDGTQVRLYVDGVLRAGPTTCPYTPNPNKVSAIAHLTGGGSNFVTGSLDEIVIYSYPLSAAQVLNHFNAAILNQKGFIPIGGHRGIGF